ncbi:MAG: hypothetical protein K2M02_01700, partial [Duncaniella sp.]|nr:hypothetical protein [Duncaniella sp.]
MKKKTLNIVKNDPWLQPFSDAIIGRYNDALVKEQDLLSGGAKSLDDFANAHQYFGLHREADG